MIVVVAQDVVEPPPPPPPPNNPRLGIGLVLIGVDGSTWDLENGPVTIPPDVVPTVTATEIAALPGIVGLGDAEVEHKWAGGTVMDGSRWGSMRHLPRQVTLPLELASATSLGWRDLDAAWSDAIDPFGECTLVVTTPDGKWRTLHMRRDSTPDSEGYDIDPLLDRWAPYTAKFVAADPFWRGATVTRSFIAEEQPEFFSAPGSGSVVNIGSSLTVDNAIVHNRGHVPTWPVYTVTGPVTGFTAGVGTNLIEYGAVPDGEQIIVDTQPTRQSVLTGNGVDAWSGVIERDFAPIPVGADVLVTAALVGPGIASQISVSFIPGYRRAW